MSKRNKNLILETRKALGLSQRALATAARTSQQQIQRIESGIQAVRIDLAVRIADALKLSLEEVFPALQKKGIRKKAKKGAAGQSASIFK